MKHIVICLLFCGQLLAQNTDYDKAWQAYAFGNFEDALTLIQQCIYQDSTNHRLIYLKGKTLENLYRYDEAIVAQRKVLQLDAENIEAKSALAALYQQSGQPALATHLYEQLSMTYPSVNRWKMNWAGSLQASGKYKDALDLLKMVVTTDSLNWLVYKNMGDCYYRQDSLEQSVVCYRKSLDIYPRNRALYGLLTRIYTTLGEDEEALYTGKEAVAIDSTNIEAWKYMGLAWYRTGKADSSFMALEKTLALGDTSKVTSVYYGMLCYHFMSFDKAEKYLGKALDYEPDNVKTMYYLAITYGYTGKPQNGLVLIDSINKSVVYYDSIRIQAEIQRGYLYRIANRYNEAAKSFISVTKSLPKMANNYYEVAVSYDMGLRKKDALDWYTRYLNKIDSRWATKNWTEAELKKNKLISVSIDRIEALKTDLFFEAEKKKSE